MDHQGARRSRSAADTRRQPPWPSPGWPSPDGADGSSYGGRPADDRFGEGTGPLPHRSASPSPGYGDHGDYGPAGSGARPLLSPGSGAQPLLSPGSGAQPAVSPGSGAHRVLGPGTGPGRLIGSGSGAAPVLSRGSGAQPVLGTGPQQTLGTGPRHTLRTGPQRSLDSGPQQALGTGPRHTLGSGPQQALGTGPQRARTPDRDFGPGREQAEPPAGEFGPWHTPSQPLTSEDTYIFAAIGVAEDPHQADTAEQAAPPGRRRDGRPGDNPPGDNRPSGGRPVGGRAGGRRSNGGRPRRRLRSRVAWLATTAVVLAGAGFAGYKFVYEPRVNAPVPLQLPTTAPGSPASNKALGKWQHIGTRIEDPEPLTIAGLFPPQFELNGASYVRTAASLTKTCSLAVYGTNLQAALQAGHCTQVLRASYISGDGTMMGTVGVINLISSSAADKAGQVTGPQEIIAPLTGKKGATSKLGTGTGVVQAEVKGHYLILMWAEFTSLKSPSGSAQRQALEQFAGNLVTGSANINLSTRMLTGKA